MERLTKQPLPSSLGSCELWSQAGRRCEAAMAAAAGAGPQLLSPIPTPHPGMSLQPWSCPPPTQWGSRATPCVPALCKQHPRLQRLLRSLLPWGEGSQFPFGLTGGDRWGPLSFYSPLPQLSLGQQPSLSIPTAAACAPSSHITVSLLCVYTLQSPLPSPRHHHHQLGTVSCCLHPPCHQSQTKTAEPQYQPQQSTSNRKTMMNRTTNFPSITHCRDNHAHNPSHK